LINYVRGGFCFAAHLVSESGVAHELTARVLTERKPTKHHTGPSRKSNLLNYTLPASIVVVCPAHNRTRQGFPATLIKTEVSIMRTHTKTFHIRFTEKEYARLCRYADKAKLPKTTYIRHLLNGCCPQEHYAIEFWALMREVHAVGNNLNQLTNLAHRVGNIHAGRLDEMMEQYKCLNAVIFDKLYSPEKINIPETLERGRLFTEAEQREAQIYAER
jgi:hypothetical protein